MTAPLSRAAIKRTRAAAYGPWVGSCAPVSNVMPLHRCAASRIAFSYARSFPQFNLALSLAS